MKVQFVGNNSQHPVYLADGLYEKVPRKSLNPLKILYSSYTILCYSYKNQSSKSSEAKPKKTKPNWYKDS